MRLPAHSLDPRLGLVVDAHVGAGGARDLELLSRTGGGDDARAQRTPELHCREAGGARGRVDEQRLTAAQRGAMDERAPCGQIREAEGRALLVGHELRQGVDVALIHRDRLRVAAPREGCEHALPEADLGHAGAHVAHDPRHFEARAEGELRPVLIGAPHEEDVGKGAADRADVDDDLARLRPGHRHVRVLERRRLAPPARQHRFHRLDPRES